MVSSRARSSAALPAAPCLSAGQKTRAVQLLIVWVCWVFFQIEGGSPGTSAILFSLAVYLAEGPRSKRRPGKSPRKCMRRDALSWAEDGSSAASLELTANLPHTGELSSNSGTRAHKVEFLTPLAAAPGNAAPGTAAAAAAAAAAATAKPPEPPASSAEQTSFEAAMTRLAGAAELGTEALIYVRRADVAEMVDVLMDHARSPEGPTVTSPALARLALVRRSKRRDLPNGSGRRARSPVPCGKRPLSAFRRLGSPAVDGPRGGGGRSGRRVASASPSSQVAPTPTVSGGRALFQDGMTPPLRDVTRTNSSSTRVTVRARSPAGSPSGENSRNGNGNAGARRVRGLQEGKQRRLRQRVRSPSPSSSAAVPACSPACVVGMTPIALTKNSGAPLAAAGGVPSTEEKRKFTGPSVLETKVGENVAAAAAAAAATPREAKIKYTPVQRTAGKREGQDFDDFWSSGWG